MLDFFEIQRRVYANLPNGASLNRLNQKHKAIGSSVLGRPYQLVGWQAINQRM